MRYLIDRLKEPGTLRSLAVVLFALLGLSPDDPRLEGAIQASILVLGILSAIIPEKSVQAAAKVENAVQTAKEIATLAVATTSEARQATAQAAQVIQSTKSLAESVAAGEVRTMSRPA